MKILCHSRPLSKTLNALNIYQLNIYQNLHFIHRLSYMLEDQSYGINFCKAKKRKSNPTHFFKKTVKPKLIG